MTVVASRGEHGVIPAMFTPTNENRKPNLRETEKLIEVLVEQLGVDGLYLLGSTGHGPNHETADRREFTRYVIKKVNDRVPVIVQVGSTATHTSVELAKDAAEYGASMISSVCPIYPPKGLEVQMEHYRQIAAATELPFLTYLFAAAGSSVVKDPAKCFEMFGEVPNFVGLKYTVPDLMTFGAFAQYLADHDLPYDLYSGPDEMICQFTMSGAAGAIGSTYNFLAPPCRKVQQLVASGDCTLANSFMPVYQGIIQRTHALQNPARFCRIAMQEFYGIDLGPGAEPSWNVESDVARESVIKDVTAIWHAAGMEPPALVKG